MGDLKLDITTSLDGFVAGPNQTLEEPLGASGERLHEWVYGLATWREHHGKAGGETNVDDEVLQEQLAGSGAVLMGRRMFSGGSGPWIQTREAGGATSRRSTFPSSCSRIIPASNSSSKAAPSRS